MWVTRVISDAGLKAKANGFTVDIRIPWYRSLPLSTVSIGEVKVDGESIPAERIRFELNGKTFALDELCAHPEEWWFVLDSAFLNVAGIALRNGSSHSVSVAVGVRPPYIPGFYRLTECTKQLTVN